MVKYAKNQHQKGIKYWINYLRNLLKVKSLLYPILLILVIKETKRVFFMSESINWYIKYNMTFKGKIEILYV